jgi:hypothetical protein
MPRVGERSRADTARQLAEAIERKVAEFEDRRAWLWSKKGNLWRKWGDKTLTIFRRKDGRFGYVYHDGEEPHYSQDGYETEDDAISALREAVTDW